MRRRRQKKSLEGTEYPVIDGVCYVPLTKGKRALIDPQDMHLIRQHLWSFANAGYACASQGTGDTRRMILMRRIITDAPKGMVVDHINGNTLDNRRSNLRVTTQQVNLHNRQRLNQNNVSGATGVSWVKSQRVWRAYIVVNYKQVHLGRFKTKEAAVLARAEAEISLCPDKIRDGPR